MLTGLEQTQTKHQLFGIIMVPPTNVSELQRFMHGDGKPISSKLAEMSQPLRVLLSKRTASALDVET